MHVQDRDDLSANSNDKGRRYVDQYGERGTNVVT